VPLADTIAAFRSAAIAKGDIASPRSLDLALLQRLADAFHELDSAGPDGRAAFKQLLADRSPHVRRWTAAQLLSEGDPDALPVLQTLAQEHSPLGLIAQRLLADHAAGTPKAPFTIVTDRS
jgi:hypothetical protein